MMPLLKSVQFKHSKEYPLNIIETEVEVTDGCRLTDTHIHRQTEYHNPHTW